MFGGLVYNLVIALKLKPSKASAMTELTCMSSSVSLMNLERRTIQSFSKHEVQYLPRQRFISLNDQVPSLLHWYRTKFCPLENLYPGLQVKTTVLSKAFTWAKEFCTMGGATQAVTKTTKTN